MRRTIQHDEFSNLPSEGRLLAPLGLLLVSRLAPLGRRSSVNLPPVPRDDYGKASGLSRERVEASQRATADDDTDRLWRWRFRAPSFLSSLRVFAPHYRLIGSYGVQLADSDWRPSSAAVHVSRRRSTGVGTQRDIKGRPWLVGTHDPPARYRRAQNFACQRRAAIGAAHIPQGHRIRAVLCQIRFGTGHRAPFASVPR